MRLRQIRRSLHRERSDEAKVIGDSWQSAKPHQGTIRSQNEQERFWGILTLAPPCTYLKTERAATRLTGKLRRRMGQETEPPSHN